jgi:hypothetical protein
MSTKGITRSDYIWQVDLTIPMEGVSVDCKAMCDLAAEIAMIIAFSFGAVLGALAT